MSLSKLELQYTGARGGIYETTEYYTLYYNDSVVNSLFHECNGFILKRCNPDHDYYSINLLKYAIPNKYHKFYELIDLNRKIIFVSYDEISKKHFMSMKFTWKEGTGLFFSTLFYQPKLEEMLQNILIEFKILKSPFQRYLRIIYFLMENRNIWSPNNLAGRFTKMQLNKLVS
jgi:hypothetical protein